MEIFENDWTKITSLSQDDLPAKVTCLVDESYVRVQETGFSNEKLTLGINSIIKPKVNPLFELMDDIYLFEIYYINLKRITYPLIAITINMKLVI